MHQYCTYQHLDETAPSRDTAEQYRRFLANEVVARGGGGDCVRRNGVRALDVEVDVSPLPSRREPQVLPIPGNGVWEAG